MQYFGHMRSNVRLVRLASDGCTRGHVVERHAVPL